MEEVIIFTIDDDIIDIEWCFIHGHTPPKGRKYRYKVDGIPYVTHHHIMSGEEVLVAAGKNAKEYILRQKIHGSWITIEPTHEIDFTKHGIEKFKTIKNEHTEGEQTNEKSLRRDFSLLEEDEDYLNSLGLDWECILQGPVQWVLVHNYPIPAGFTINQAIVAIRIEPLYPTVQLDMLYFYPAITRKDNLPMGALTDFPLDEKTFQQWSRHRTANNPWRPGIDNLSTHLPLVAVWLENEFTKNQTNALRA